MNRLRVPSFETVGDDEADHVVDSEVGRNILRILDTIGGTGGSGDLVVTDPGGDLRISPDGGRITLCDLNGAGPLTADFAAPGQDPIPDRAPAGLAPPGAMSRAGRGFAAAMPRPA